MRGHCRLLMLVVVQSPSGGLFEMNGPEKSNSNRGCSSISLFNCPHDFSTQCNSGTGRGESLRRRNIKAHSLLST